MGDVVHITPPRRPRGCDPRPQANAGADPRTDLLLLLSAARAVGDARNRTQRKLAIARLGAAVAAIDRGWIA